jgi:hypothetical protein
MWHFVDVQANQGVGIIRCKDWYTEVLRVNKSKQIEVGSLIEQIGDLLDLISC